MVLIQADIYNKPDKYVELDEELPATLLDQKDVSYPNLPFSYKNILLD